MHRILLNAALWGCLLFGVTPTQAQQSLQDPHTDPEIVSLLKSYENKVYFTQNKGQWPKPILYKADFPMGQALATPEGMLVGTFDAQSLNAFNDQAERQEVAQHQGLPFTEKQVNLKGHGWLMKFLNASPNMRIVDKDAHGDVFNYFLGDDPSKHATDVKSFNEIWYNEVYTNTDVRYYPSQHGTLEYDIICRPGSNPKEIALSFDGIDKKYIDFNGNLVLQTSVGDMSIAPPIAYQVIEGRETPVKAAYVLTETGALTFALGEYDKSQTLVIDPIALIWATWASNNASSTAHGHGIHVDPATGEIYIIGWYNSTGLITVNAFQNTNAGGVDIIIGKYKEPATVGGAGTRIWQTYLGGTGEDNPYALDQGPDGNIYITGVIPATGSTAYPMIGGTAFGLTASTVDNRAQTGTNVFITKINPAGNAIKSCVVGGNGAENIYDIRMAANGDVIVCGTNRSTNLLTLHPGSGATNTLSGSSDVLVFKVTQNLNSVLWVRNFGGSSGEQANIMLSEPLTGDIFVAGTTSSSNFPTLVPRQGTFAGTSAGFVQKLNGNGVRKWSSYFNSAAGKTTSILCMEFNTTRTKLVFAGLTSGLATSNVSASGVFQPAYAGGSLDFFVCNMDTNQTFNWGSYLGGNGNEINMMGLNLDLNNDVYIFGYTDGSFPTAGGPFQAAKPGGADKTFTKMAATGASLIYSTYYGTSGTESDPVGERGIKFNDCHIYTLVTSDNNGLPLTQGAITTNKASSNSVLEPGIVEWGSPPPLSNNTVIGNQVVCSGNIPTGITGTIPAYNLPNITRNGVISTHPPLGAPAAYQWQKSLDGGTTWINIPGATSQDIEDSLVGPITGQVLIRRIVNGDLCVVSTDNNIITLNVFSVNPVVTPSCMGLNNGAVNTTLTGGVAPITYLWSNGATTPNISLLAPGVYTVSATDATGCTATSTVTVSDYTEAVILGSYNFCPGGSTTLTATPAGASYLWNNGATTQAITVNTAGTYSVTITYVQGCTQSASAMATQLAAPVVTIVETSGLINNDGILCAGESATLFASPGPIYSWNTGAITPSITVNTSGTYTVTTTGGTCPGTMSANIVVVPLPIAGITGDPLRCAAETILLTATGGTSYVWSPGGATTAILPVTAAGTYGVEVTNAAGCKASTTFSVTTENCYPTANADYVTTPEDTPIAIAVLGNDTFGGDGPSTGAIQLVVSPVNGVATVNTNGTPGNPTDDFFNYAPGPNYNGSDNFIYRICDSNGDCDTAIVYITVVPVNDPPIAVDDTDTTNSGTPVVVDVTANDTDTDGNIDPTTVTIITPPTQGTVTVNPVTGEVTYTPNANMCGTDTFVYQVCDDGTPLPAQCDQAQVTIVIEDTQNPVITGCPVNIVLTNAPGICGAIATWTAPTATDNCSGVTTASNFASGATFPIGVTTVTYIATDALGNMDTCSFTVTVTDTQAPSIAGCPTNITLNNTPGNCNATATWTLPTATDNCPGVILTSNYASGATFPIGTTAVTYTATDASGNIRTCTFNVTVNDVQFPVITGCPVNIVVNNAANSCSANATWTLPTATDNCTGVILTSNYASGATFPIGTTAVVYTATDASGNITTCTFNVTVNDVQFPVITGCPTNIVISNTLGNCSAIARWTVPTTADNCPGVTLTSNYVSDAIFPIGTTTVIYTATDASGNITTCTFNVTVNDVQFPVITGCPMDIVVNNSPGNCNATATWIIPQATDNCSGVILTSNYASGATFPIGTTTVIYTATDASGNITICTFNVTVNDVQFPVIMGCPVNIVVNNAANSCSANATWTLPTATDNCSGVILTSNYASGATFPIGTTAVVYTATDASGNITICTFNVTVNDVQFPVITGCPTNIVVDNTQGNCDAIATWNLPTATDNCPGVILTSNYASGAILPIGTTTVTYTATDASGNITTCTFNVTVNDVQFPVITGCPEDIVVDNTQGNCDATATWNLPTSTDNCPGVILTSNYASGATFPIGTTAVTYTATDASGNITTCTFNVTVNDVLFPVITGCPTNIVVDNTPNSCNATATWTIPQATDNCSGVTLVSNYASGATFPIGTTAVTYTATDVSGNITTCTFNVTVTDVQLPVITGCPADMLLNNAPKSCDAVATWKMPTVTDNCPGATFTSNYASGGTFPIGNTVVTYTATDASGNVSTCSFTVTVIDTELPVISNCPTDIVLNTDDGLCQAVAAWKEPIAGDNCSNGFTFTASHASGDVFPVGVTAVTYTATDSAGNVSVCTFYITVADGEGPGFTGCPENINSCSDTITWTPPTATDNCGVISLTSTHNPGDVFPSGATTVTYTATDASGNTGQCSFVVTVSQPQVEITHTHVTCYGYNNGTALAGLLSATGPCVFNWGSLETGPFIHGLQPGIYHVIVTDSLGCQVTASVTIIEPEPFSVAVETVGLALCGFSDADATVLTLGGTMPYAYLWSNGQTTESLYGVPYGTYSLLATDANGCQDSLALNIDCEFGKVPQLLTPNGDGHNDTWVIPGLEKYPGAQVEIFNRWGNSVYKVSPYNNDWNGKSTGMLTTGTGMLPAGTYYYMLTLKEGDKAMVGYLELEY